MPNILLLYNFLQKYISYILTYMLHIYFSRWVKWTLATFIILYPEPFCNLKIFLSPFSLLFLFLPFILLDIRTFSAQFLVLER